MIVKETLVIRVKFDGAGEGGSFPGDNRFYHKQFRFLLPGYPVVVPARGAPDKAVARLSEDLVLGFFPALGTQNGDKH